MTKQNIHTRPHQIWSFTPVARTLDFPTFEYFYIVFGIFSKLQNNTILVNCILNRNSNITRCIVSHRILVIDDTPSKKLRT